MTLSDDVKKGLIAGAFGLVGTLVPAAISWSHDRSATSARARILEEATKRLAFWEQWLKLSTQVAEPSDPTACQRLQQELALLSDILQKDSFIMRAQVSKLRGKVSEFHSKVEALSWWRRLLLLYMPARAAAWFPRIFFFAGIAFALFIPFGFAAPDQPLSLQDFAISELCFLVWIAIFRALSHWLEQPKSNSAGAHAADVLTPTEPPPKPI